MAVLRSLFRKVLGESATEQSAALGEPAAEQSAATASSTVDAVSPVVEDPAIVLVHDFADAQPVAILGYDFTTPDVLRAAIAFGFQPIALYAPDGAAAPGSAISIARAAVAALGVTPQPSFLGADLAIEVLDEGTFGRLLAERGIPILVGAYGLRERDYFRDNLLFARNHLKFEGQILHPAFLADYYRNPNRRYAIIGFPGSGNMIFQNIYAKLFPPQSVPMWAKEPLSAVIAQFALSYWSSLSNMIADAFDDAGRWQHVAGPSHARYGAMYLGLRDQMAPAVVAGLPMRSHVWSNPWHTSHEPLTSESIAFFDKQNFHITQIWRHPLDLIVSNAAKITSAVGDRAPQLLLQNDDWMESILDDVEAYCKLIVEHKDAVSSLRYEELLATPVPMIRRMAEILDVTCDDGRAEEIWSSLDGRPLSASGHLWDPRAGKWREFIPARLARRIRGSRLREYAEAMGYEMPLEAFEGTRAELPSHKCKPLDVAWQDARWESSTGKRHAIMHPKLYREQDSKIGLLMISAREFEAPMERLRRSPVLADVLSAGRLKPWPEAPLIAEFLGLR